MEIKLSKPLEIDGKKVEALDMREPIVNDQLVMEEIGGTAGNMEVNLFANLCAVPVDALRKMSMKDYKKLQGAYKNFIN